MAHNQQLGSRGEALAESFLRNKGYEILCRNYRVRGGEIDIVAKDGATLVFAEVKTRLSSRFSEAREAVDHRKKMHLICAAQRYLAQNALSDAFCRFDVLEVDADRFEIRHWENAFEAR